MNYTENKLVTFFTEVNKNPIEYHEAIQLLNRIYSQLSSDNKAELSRVWREGKIMTKPVTINNLIKYFNYTKKHHIETIKNLEGDLLKTNKTELNKLYEVFTQTQTKINTPLEPVPITEPIIVKSRTEVVATAISDYIQKQKFPYYKNEGELTIIYVEGMDINLNKIENAPNKFNDVRIVMKMYPEPQIIGFWEATTAPGIHYTNNPMDLGGAFKIIPGWHEKVWQFGYHLKSDHPALVQTGGVVCGFRDKNKDFVYANDNITCGWYGINQHHGWNMPFDNIANTSAGCLVGRTIQGHLDFIKLLKTDVRYLGNPNFCFSTLIVPSEKLLNLNE